MNGEDFALWDSAPLFEPLEARVLLSVSFPGQLYPVGEWPTAGALADFDEDGLPDVATANSNEPTVSVLLSDGRGGFADQRKLDVADKPEWLITADFNADGHADLATANDLANNVSVLLGNGDGTFQAHADFVVGQDPRYLASGDFNRDGHLDLAVTNYDDDTVSLLFGKGDGRFQAQELLSVGQSPWSVLAADLNDDGKLDLATADFDDDRLSVLLGNGDGTFVAQAPLVVRDGPQMVTCADLNEDGPPDLIVTNRREDTVSLLTGNGDGSFQAHREVSVEPNPMAVYAVDLDADSHLDLVTSHYGGEVCVLAGVGDGTFAGRAWYQSVAYSSLVPHDFDGDGDLDLAVPARHHDAVVILPNQGDGALLPRSEPVGASPDSVVTADFDGDGHLDLATSNMADDTASVLLGNGDGTFRAHVPYTVGDGPDYIVAADLDGDDVVDLAVTNSRDDTVSVLLGKGDGSFLGQEISVVGEDPQSPVVADFNNDEVPDLAVANNDVDTVSVLLGKGDGTFHDQRTSPAGPLPTALAAGDFDGDGFTDLVVVNSYELSLSLLLGVGDGTFHDPQAMAIDSSAHTIVSADLNGDGLDDLVVSHSDDIVSVRLGRGDGTFDSAGSYPVLDGAFDMDMADVDGDGRLDLVVANYWSQVLSVLTGNGDGTFGSRYDFACAGSRAAVAGDFDEDGAVDLAAADGRGSVIILLSTLDWDSRIDAPIRAGEILQGDTLRFAGAGWATRQPYGFRWGFGDGRSSTLETPGLVTFRTPGTFDVTFAVVDAVGASDPQPATLTLTVAADPGSAPDLVATTIELPEGLALGEPAEIAYTVVNEGDAAISGQSWHDALYLSADTWLDAGDLLLAESPTISQDLAPGETFSGIIEATIPAEAAGGTCYLILSADDGWEVLERHQLNNELAAAADVTIPELASGVPVSIAFTEDSRERYYRIDVPAGRNLLLSLDDLDDAGVNELYLQFAQLPTRGTFTARHAVSGEADQQILLPVPAPGTWYILAYAAEGPGECTLVAELEDLVVLDASPGCFVDVQPMALALTGAGFDGGTAVELVAGDATTYAPSSLTVDSYTRMTASFDAGTVPAGLYTVRVSKSGVAPVELADAVEVVVGAEAELVTNLIVPDKLGYHALATIYLEYANTGDVAMPAPLLALTATQDGKPGARMTLDSSLVWQGFSISTMPEGFSNAIHILASGETPGQLGPHESCRVPVYWAGWEQPWDFSYPPFEFGLGVVTVDSTEPIDWASLKDQMRPRTVSAEAWEPVWENFIEQTGLTAGEYVAMLDDNAAYLGRLAERVLDIERLVNFEYHQANGLWPWQDLIEAVDVRIAAPGLPLTFQRSFSYEITGRYELGPLGYGWSHNWQWALEEGSDGTVRITTPTGGERVFGPARFGRYISEPGDYATLTALGGGAFLLTEPDGVAYAFRADGLLDYVEDLNGNRITAGYTDGLLTSLAHSCGQALQLEYNAAGRIERILDSYGREVAFTYDSSSGHLLDGKGTDNLTTHYSYSTGGTDIQTEHALTGIEYPDGTGRTFTYDSDGRLYETYRDGEAEKLTYSYDSAGTVCQTDAYGAASRYFLGAEGGVLKVQNAVDNAVQYQFDDHFNLVQISDSAGRAHSFRYDYEGNLTHWTDPLGYRTRFSYGDFGRLAYFTDANSHKTTYTYDSQGNLTAITYPDAVVESFEYDAAGNLTDWTNGRQATIGYTPDAQGRITRKDYDDGSHVDYTYDARGNLETATDATGTTSFTHNANDWLTRIDYPDGRFLEFTYDTAGRRDSSTDELGHTVNYHYDAVGRLERLTDGSDAEIVLYARNAAGRLERAELGNGVYTTYEYDAAGQLLHLVNYAPDDTVLSRFDYTYDAAGRRDGMTTLDGTWTYAHDPAGQLIAATFELDAGSSIPAQEMAWTYDRVGNRRSATTNGATIEYTTNNRNQYVTVGAASYEYDDDGNLIGVTDGSDTWSFEYDDEGRLTRAVTPDGTWEYEYDPLGRRVATVEGAQRTEYVIDPIGLGNVVGQYDGTGALEAHYVHGLGLTSRVDAAGQPAYYTFDALGSTSELTDDAGAVLNAYAYDPFGKLLLQTGTLPDPFQFVGQFGVMTEDTGLDLMRARSYDPALGRFVSEDPIGLAGGDVLLYRYARNAPVDFIDPLGLFDVYDFATWELAAAGTAAGVACALVAPSCPVTGTGAALAGLGVLAVAELRPPPLPRPRTPRPDEIEMEDAEFTWTTDLDAIAESIGAVDPNAKTGPTGFGDSGYVAAGRLLAYRVDFENEETATAPAQYVSVCDQLDADLDWTTFDLTEVGFGEHFIATPAGTQHFETVVPVTCEGQDIEVHIEAGIDLETGLLVVQFMSLDAETHLPPDVTIGFLPPEDGSGCGMGHFSYTIENAPDVPSGTEVRNVAVIQFDFGEIIATNQVDPHDPGQGTDPAKECLNTIDAGPPTSQVDPLEAEVSDLSFTVSWSGQDDDGGSGLRGYDVYVSDDGGPYELWLDDVAETSAVFTGEHLHTYGFYSIADDNVGHREKPPGAADTQTLVNDTTPPVIESWQSAAEHGEGVGEALLEIPDDGGFSEPRTAGVTRLVIGFSEAIDPASFTPASVRLAGNDQAGDPVDLSAIDVATATTDGDTVGIINFTPALPDVARYIVQIEGVTDVAGNPLAGDNDRVFTALVGDAMSDLRVNAIDLSYIWPRRTIRIDGVSEDQTRSDVNCDGRVNAIDLSAAWPRRGADMRVVRDPVLPGKLGGAGTSGDVLAAAAAIAATAGDGDTDAPTGAADATDALPAARVPADMPKALPARPVASVGVVTVPLETAALEASAGPRAAGADTDVLDVLSLSKLLRRAL